MFALDKYYISSQTIKSGGEVSCAKILRKDLRKDDLARVFEVITRDKSWLYYYDSETAEQ